jgi:PucR C-terminal helix-turn-helix domain
VSRTRVGVRGSSTQLLALDAERDYLQHIARALLERVETLTDDLVDRILASEPAYLEGSSVALDDLRLSCRSNLERIVQSLGHQVPDGIDPYDAPAATGRRRAAQGMPLEAVLHSYRLGGRVVWDGIVDLAGNDPVLPGDRILLQVAGLVWEEIDSFSAALASAYRDEELRLRSQHRHQQQRDVAALLAGAADPQEIQRLSERLGLPDGSSTVAVSVLLDDHDEPLFSAADCLAAADVHAVWALTSGMEIGLVRLADGSRSLVMDLLRSRGRQRAGVSAVYTALTESPAAARLAALAAQTLPVGNHVAGIEERLPEALVAAAPDVAGVLIAETVDRVRRARDAQVLLQTVDALIAENGSFSRAGDRLYCHRNTVIHRIARVATMSGHDPALAQDRLLWSLALAAHHQRAGALAAHHQPAGDES